MCYLVIFGCGGGGKDEIFGVFLVSVMSLFCKERYTYVRVSLSSPDKFKSKHFHETWYEHLATKSSPHLCTFEPLIINNINMATLNISELGMEPASFNV
jgi:hypothetical protein